MKWKIKLKPRYAFSRTFDTNEEVQEYIDTVLESVNNLFGQDGERDDDFNLIHSFNAFGRESFIVTHVKEEDEMNSPEHYAIDTEFKSPIDQVRAFTKQDSKDESSAWSIYDRLCSQDVSEINEGVSAVK